MKRGDRCPNCGRFVSLRGVGSFSTVQFYDHGWYCNPVCLADWRAANEVRPTHYTPPTNTTKDSQ